MRSRGAVIGHVFGSYGARATAGYLSDIDVGVVFPVTMSKDIQVFLASRKSEMLWRKNLAAETRQTL